MSPETGRIGLEDARQRLRDLGYLNGRVERFVFRRALEGRGGLLLPAVLLGALAAALAGLAAVGSVEPGFGASWEAMAALLAHLFLADLVPAGLLALGVALWADRTASPAGAATAAGLTAAGIVFLLWIAGVWGLAREIPTVALLWGAPLAVAALLLARSVRSGFLAQAFAHSRVLPAAPRKRVFLAAAAAGILAAIAIFAARRAPLPAPAPRPSPRGGPIVVVAVDGLFLDTEPAAAWTGLRELLARGRAGWWPIRAASPPEIWTDVATGVPASRHGVRALERVRPRGSPLALRPPFGTAWYLRWLGPRLSLTATAPVSSRDRECLSFWEVAASSGLPTLAVDWWASGPWPGADVTGNEEILSRSSDGIAVDREAMGIFRRRRSSGQAIQTVYLPGLDILRGHRDKRSVDGREIQVFLEDEVSAAAAGAGALVVLAVDSHGQPGALGRMVVFDGVRPWSMVRIRPQDVAASILARAGVPVARDIAGKPVEALFRPGSLETTTVASYGPRVAPGAGQTRQSDREYLEKLKSLGYLQ